MRSRPQHASYRPEIDGLRAVAVVPVILSHAHVAALAGGFVGVDVFFVISGYLITGIIRREIEAGRFSLAGFYERRARRILPALTLVALATVPFAWAWLMPGELRDFFASLVAVFLFVSNHHFADETGYFAATAEVKPLLHTWSLAVEEQFYLLFPPLLLLLSRLPRRAIPVALGALAAASLGISIWAVAAFPESAYFLLPTRAWELIAGALLARPATPTRVPPLLAEAAAALGLVLVAFAIVTFDTTTPYPGLRALVPVIGTALVIACARPPTLVARLLALPPLVGIGLVSYSAYLWYQPVFALARTRFLDGPPPSLYAGLVPLIFALAWLSWRFVERPFRDRAWLARRTVLAGALALSATFVTLGTIAGRAGLSEARLTGAARQVLAWGRAGNPRTDACMARPEKYIPPAASCVYGSAGPARIALMGDSHADAIAHRLGAALARHGEALRELTYGACAPAPGFHLYGSRGVCARYNREAQNFVLSPAGPDIVILFARWAWYLEGRPFDNGEGGVEKAPTVYALPLGQSGDYVDDPERIATVGRIFRAAVETLLAHGKRVVLVYPVPEAGWNVPLHLARELEQGRTRAVPLSVSYEVVRARLRNARVELDRLPDHPRVIRLRPESLFCDTLLPGRCVVQMNGRPLYRDEDHLNDFGAAILARAIVARMVAAGWLAPPPLRRLAGEAVAGEALHGR